MHAQITRAAGMTRPLVPAALLTSGLIHLVLTPQHLVEAPILGLGFAAVAVLQLTFGTSLLARPARHLHAGALVLAVFSLAVYLLVRLAGLPLDHGHAGRPALIELVCKGAEVLAIGGLLIGVDLEPLSAHTARLQRRIGPFSYRLGLVAAGLLVAVAATYAGSALMPSVGHPAPHEHTQPHEHARVHPAAVSGGRL